MLERQLFHAGRFAGGPAALDRRFAPDAWLGDAVGNRTMVHADYQTALKNGIDAARSGSRMMARLHLLKAADLAPDDVAAHLWLAWVAETPADALVHLDEALARKPGHALTRVGRAWTKLMAEFDAARDYSQCDLGDLGESLQAAGGPPMNAPDDVSRTQRLGGQTLVELRKKLDSTAHDPAASRSASVGPTTSPGEAATAVFSNSPLAPPRAPSDPLDVRRTVRMELVQRERPDDVETPSLAFASAVPTEASQKSAAASAGEEMSPLPEHSPNDEPPTSGTIRIDPNAVKRALAESVIAEMTEPDRSAQTTASVIEAECVDEVAANITTNGDEEPQRDAAAAVPLVDEYTEPPRAAVAPESDENAGLSRDAAVSAGPRVLVVDDSPTVRKLVSATLEAQGYRVACAASGYEAVEVLAHATPDALVIEVDLPRLDGLHLCKLLRSQDATRQTPVIFLTRRSGTMDRMRAKMVGATAYLTKPFRSVALIEEMAACCPVAAS